MPSSGLSGQYGQIPYSVIRKKYEMTSMDEPTDLTENFQRDILKDLSPDAPFFESDQIRRDNGSEERLSLRYTGHRSGEVPDAPDLFLELTERDPRGTALDPNMRKLVDQSWSRAGYIKFYDDSDNSVTEREKRPEQLIRQLRDSFEAIKARYKIFSTSKDGMMGAANYNFSQSGSQSMIEGQNAAYRDVSEHARTPAQNYTVMMSNNWPLGWDTTSDLEFKVAQYGQIRTAAGEQDTNVTRHNVVDRKSDQLTTFQDQVVSVGLSQLMSQLVLDRLSRVDPGDTRFERIVAAATPHKYNVFTAPGGNKAGSDRGDQTQHEAFGAMENFVRQLNSQTRAQSQNIEIQLQFIEKMDQVARSRGTDRRSQNMADAVMSTYMSNGTSMTNDRTKLIDFKNTHLAKQNVSTTADLLDSLKVAQLGTLALNKRRGNNMNSVNGEPQLATSWRTRMQMGQAPTRRATDTSRETQDHQTFGVRDRLISRMGSKYTREIMDTDITRSEINDV